ncbi:YcjF family protein [Caenispirillum bisanense]|uniref:YcjF family protein n=1 Tax=Caenispirillum bisanense TaxID=414052 RepID=UPI0031E1A2AE
MTSLDSHITFDPEKILRLIQAKADDLHKNLQHVNIVVVGRTGVGKSTLINTVFGEDVAKAGMGKPITQDATWYKAKNGTLRILDTKGLEAKDFARTLALVQAEVEKARSQGDINEQIHVAWMCIDEPSARVQQAEIDVIKMLNSHEIPVIVALTKHGMNPTFQDNVRTIMLEEGCSVEGIVPVSSVSPNPAFPICGIDILVQRTNDILPSAARNAFRAAQRVNLKLKSEAAEKIVYGAAASAAGVAVSPIPFSDALAIVPIQIGMVVAISRVYDIESDNAAFTPLITGILGGLGLSMVGRWAAGGLIKLIPGAGSIFGGLISATIAGGLTTSLGLTYIAFLTHFQSSHHRLPTLQEVADLFPTFFKTNKVEKEAPQPA